MGKRRVVAKRLTRLLIISAWLVGLQLGLSNPGAAAPDRSALWNVIRGLCVPAQQAASIPFPCRSVDLQRRFALLKVAGSHILLVPTTKIEGIESPELLATGAPNYWEFAWEARALLPEANGSVLSRDDVGLAVNSAQARTQDQLHIHIGCLRLAVRAQLHTYEKDIHQTWSRLPFGVGGHRYWIMRVEGDDLFGVNPFELLAGGFPAARDDMASQTIVVAGAKFRDGRGGFYILASHSEGGDAATGEALLDYNCEGRYGPAIVR